MFSQVYAQGIEGFKKVDDATLNQLNPLKLGQRGGGPDLSTPGAIISQIFVFAFPLAGLILFVMIVWGGFEMISGAATKKSIDAGRQRVQSALVGFILLFISYWLMRVLEAVFGLRVL